MELTSEDKQIIINVLSSINAYTLEDAKRVNSIVEKLRGQIKQDQPTQLEDITTQEQG